jgi:hypothetical protein
METTKDEIASLTAGKMKLKIYPSKRAAGEAAALAVATEMRRLAALQDQFAVIFATGAAQFDTLEFLTSTPALPWKKVRGFHLDEYVGLDETHPASFRNFLRQRLTQRVEMGAFFEMDGTAADLDAVIRNYLKELHVAEPQLCLLGIGAGDEDRDPGPDVPAAASGGGLVPELAAGTGKSAHVNYPDSVPCTKVDCLCAWSAKGEGSPGHGS